MSGRKIPQLFISRAFQSPAEPCIGYKEHPDLIRKPPGSHPWLEFSPFVHPLFEVDWASCNSGRTERMFHSWVRKMSVWSQKNVSAENLQL